MLCVWYSIKFFVYLGYIRCMHTMPQLIGLQKVTIGLHYKKAEILWLIFLSFNV